jgi:ribosomal protein S12 methylthiotransferase
MKESPKKNKKLNQKRTIHFVSLGCAKNRVDTEVMAGIAIENDLEIIEDADKADIVVVNTCAFIESARAESVDTLLKMARLKTCGGLKKLVVAGCLSQRYGDELAAEMPELDNLLGTASPDGLEHIIKNNASRNEVGAPGHFTQKPNTPRFVESSTASSYIKIADGCSRQCAFCAIPAIRGKATSRPVEEVLAEASQLASIGIKEVNLVAQDTCAYGNDLASRPTLADLVRALDTVDGILWVRLLYLYPDSVTDDLLEAIGSSKKTVPYLDIPIQHASAAMLRRMRRGHGPKVISDLVKRIRSFIPEAVIRTTVLVGHPGESDEDFAKLLKFVEWARFDHLGAFRYSDEEDTPSFGTGPNVSGRNSYNRLRKVMALQRRISKVRNRARIGTELDVLVEGSADDQGWVLKGRHMGQAPEIDGDTYIVSSDARLGDVVRGRVIRAEDHDLVVEPVDRSTRLK